MIVLAKISFSFPPTKMIARDRALKLQILRVNFKEHETVFCFG